MTSVRLFFVILVSYLALTACGKKAEEVPPPGPPPAVVIAEKRTEDAKQAASAAQTKLEKAEKELDTWKPAFFGALVLVALAFFGGIALGSSSRKQAERSRQSE